MIRPHSRLLSAFIILVSILSITVLHLLTPMDRVTLHQIYQRLYYVPIVASAFIFGLKGGILTALFASLAYLPHVALQWHHTEYNYALNQYAEIVLFNFIGVVTGILGDRSRKGRERTQQTSEELQRAYAELRQTFEQLLQAERLATFGELSAGIVHEIRNPLGSIKGAVEIIEDELPEDSPRREFADIAKREVDRLDRLVQEFLSFARPPQLEKSDTDLNSLVRSVSLLIEQRAASQNVTIENHLDNNLPPIIIDAEQIKQILLNLAINALQAMPNGGRLFFRTSRKEGKLIIEVEDEGGGVDPKVIARIFDPFFTTKEKGIGLGLSVAYKIAVQHGGSLSVANSNPGAIFKLMLPYNQAELHDI